MFEHSIDTRRIDDRSVNIVDNFNTDDAQNVRKRLI